MFFFVVFFGHSRASNSEMNILIWPEFELIRDFMAVLFVWRGIKIKCFSYLPINTYPNIFGI